MEGASSGQRRSRAPKSSHRKWTVGEDEVLVATMVELHNIGTYNADCGFRTGYLQELERMLLLKMPNGGIKAKPHIESRIRTLKKDWSIVYDMVYGRNTSGFGWNAVRKMVTAEKEVWDAYISSHPDAGVFLYKSFPYLDEFTLIYGKDRATGEDAQTAVDVIEEMEIEEQCGQNMDAEVPIDEHAGESSQQQSVTPNAPRRKRSMTADGASTDVAAALKSFHCGLRKLRKSMDLAVKRLSIDPSRRDVENLHEFMQSIEGISQEEMKSALLKLPRQKDNLALLYKLPVEDRLDYIRSLLD